ncbi:MAG: SpoIIE family protein phosphatase, partial [Actinomycetes bacterium]
APHGLQVATRYRPVEQGAQVGGDFYDLFQVAPGRWGIVIGDVSGKGVRAASLTALARHTVRTAARSEPGPGLVLGVLNDELMESEQDHFCTVAYLEVQPSADGCDVRLSLAGHPQPVIRRADGGQEVAGDPGMAAGLLPMAEVADTQVRLCRGDVMVLVTDGVVEARNPSGEFADDLLASALATLHGDAEAVADAVVDAAVGFAGGRPRDDIAVVVLRVPGSDDPRGRHDVFVLELPPEAASASRARAEALRFCAAHGLDSLADTVELLTSELVTNVVRHAGTPVGLRLCRTTSRLRVEVTDGSRLRPVRRLSSPEVDSGRGLHLLERLAPEWGVRRTPEGKTVWFEFDA